MTAFTKLLNTYRNISKSEREKGTYFEDLIQSYLVTEPFYKDTYKEVLTFKDWATRNDLPANDTGIDLIGLTHDEETHAIQCKLYDSNYTLQKNDIDSFFTASGKKVFSQRIIVSTTNKWSLNAENSLEDQVPPVTKIDLTDLENSLIDWDQYQPGQSIVLKKKKTLRPHQNRALEDVKKGLEGADRGKLIMACGTGKTFTSLKIAETIGGTNSKILFLVPSLSLLSQTLTEWTQECNIPLHSFAVCSDSDVGKKQKDSDLVKTYIHELQYPATTDSKKLAKKVKEKHDVEHMTVIFSTYHSIGVISEAQQLYNLSNFDLIICDEAHRTTGATFLGDDESSFVKVHDNEVIKSSKRLYMTATPRIYGDIAKVKAATESVTLCSMDDEELYGKQLHLITFSNAVNLDLLVDYKVIVLAVEESHINRKLQKLLSDDDNQIKVDDAAKIVGCWKALSKMDLQEDLANDNQAMKRAVAFCQVIEKTYKGKGHKVSSKQIAEMFQAVVEAYQEEENIDEENKLICEASHVDGSMNASEKEEHLNWLKEDTVENTCRILSNVRCLSEGVDVPALDAVLFLTPRNSQVDVVQSVGRVMRKAEGKKRGYVILPVVIPAGMEPHEALNDNKTYKVVWQVLQALRSHDDRFDSMINKMDLELNKSMLSKMEVVAISDKYQPKKKKYAKKEKSFQDARNGINIGSSRGLGNSSIFGGENKGKEHKQVELDLEFGEIERALYAKVVSNCGNRHHWEDWANDIAKIARTHIDRIHAILEDDSNVTERKAFSDFAEELRDDLNDAITDDEIIEMLAQHLITKPVFEALFDKYSFAQNNPISQAMQSVLDALHEHSLHKEADTLNSFYASVKERASNIESAEGKQKIVVELYDKFFRNAFPKMTERLGIVYTPVEVVDFIIYSVDHLLKKEFNLSLGSKGVHILDPFTGTGTFITRMLQSGLIKKEDLAYKYKNEIHANEIVLLAYYIAAINIEAVYHSLSGVDYTPFEGICLTDTFQLHEHDDFMSNLMVQNSGRRMRQKNLDVRVIIGNPPYSIGQGSQNDNNANISYPLLDSRIETTYAAHSNANLSRGLYDSYIRAIRWASDQITRKGSKKGIIGFVTNAGWIEANSADGMRKCLSKEFSNIHIFHLRGNQRTKGELSRKEGGKIFGSGSRAPIAVTFLVKNPDSNDNGKIFFHDIGDYLTTEEKLKITKNYKSLDGITKIDGWCEIIPDKYGDWLNQRDDTFNEYISLGIKRGKGISIFSNFATGLNTSRDSWCYNSSRNIVSDNIENMISFYNDNVERFIKAYPDLRTKSGKERESLVNNFIDTDQTKISWSANLKKNISNQITHSFSEDYIVKSVYRPFTKQWFYNDRSLVERVSKIPSIFPKDNTKNIAITINSNFKSGGQISLIVATYPDFHINGDSQCFPLYLFEQKTTKTLLFDTHDEEQESDMIRYDAITDDGLRHFTNFYDDDSISKEDLFYYVYGILHSEDYLRRFADNLSKELPRIPRIKKIESFWLFSKAGRNLANLHLNYETIEKYPVKIIGDISNRSIEDHYRVTKMKHAKKKVYIDGKKKSVNDLSTLIYNSFITVENIPEEAYQYVINGKPALNWVVERQSIKTDKQSGIVNDANLWAIETMGNPAYPLELFQRVITVSLETMKIVKSLPDLDI